jgi:hypothetical protein
MIEETGVDAIVDKQSDGNINHDKEIDFDEGSKA